MVARKNPSPVPPQPKRPGLVSLRFRTRLRRPLPHDHAEGGGRGAVGGGGQVAAILPRRGSPPRRGGGDCDRRREGGRRCGDRELSSRSTPARRGGGNGRRLEGGGGAGRGGDGKLWPGSPPPPLGRGDGGRRREGAGRGGDWELSSRLPPPPPRQGGVDCRRRDGGGARRGGYGELSAGSASAGGGAAGRGDEVVVVLTCHVCSKTFDRVKALHGHMRNCRAAAEKLSPVALRQDRAKKQRVEKKKADDEGLRARALEQSWAGIGRRRRRRRRIPIHGGGDSRAPRAKWSRVAAQDRAPIAVILREVTGLQVGEEDLDQPWAAETVRAVQDLMSLSAGEAGFGPVADGHSEQRVVTVAPDAPATVTTEPAPDAAAAVTITAAPATPSAVAVATASDTVASAVTIAAAPDATKGKEVTVSNGNGGVAAIAGADEIKVYHCPKCFKTFNSYQALGGHMAHHKICEKKAKEMKDVAAAMNGRELHVCAKCSKTFPTGQALGGHMRLHYADQLLGAGKTSVWAAPCTASGLSLPNPAAAGRSPFVFTLLKQEGEPPEEMAMTGNGVPVYVPAATAFGSSLPAATSSSFPLAITMPKQEEKPPGVMAMAPRNGLRPRGGFRLFGVDIAEGPKEEPKE